MQHWLKITAALGLSALAGLLSAQEPAPMPPILTLPQALSMAEAGHPRVDLAQARESRARAQQDSVAADDDVKTTLRGRLQWVDPSTENGTSQNDDHHIGLFFDKRLYDFGYTDARLKASELSVAAQQQRVSYARNLHRLAVAEAYFAVILADLRYIRDNEDMATAFVRFDRTKDRNAQGQVSDIVLYEADSRYHAVRSRRYASDVARRASRAKLAQLLNRPGDLPADLANPDLPQIERDLPDVEPYIEQAKQQHPQLIALRHALAAAREQVQAARKGDNPVISGSVEASEYTRELGSRDRLRAGLHFELPLSRGGSTRAQIKQAEALVDEVNAQLREREMQVEQEVLDAWHDVYIQKAKYDEARKLIEYRDLYLDRSRALYELDIRTDLGDAMVEFSQAQLQRAQAQFNLALAWARLDLLTGQRVFDQVQAAQSEGSTP